MSNLHEPTDIANPGKPGRRGDAWLGLVLVGVSLAVLYLASFIKPMGVGGQADPGPRAMPMGLAAILFLGGVVEVVRSRLGGRKRAVAATSPDGSSNASIDMRSLVVLLVSILAYVVMLPWLGFGLSTLIMATVMMVMFGNSAKTAAVVSIVMVLVIYVIFVRLFKVPLPGGIFDLPF